MNRLKIYERGAIIFLFIFFASLTNSIFVNQIGYYGALFFLLLTWYETKDNPFSKNGLELALLLYLAAEFLALVFTANKANAFENFLKRLFLMPIMYVIPVLLTKKNLKQQLMIIAGFGIIGMLLYLVASYRYVLLGEYQRSESGPSLFQYPITAAEIMTFFMLFFFALALEKGKIGMRRVIMLALFVIAGLAVMATYKKTGWMGGAAGVMVIILMQRKWIINIVFLAAVVLVFLFAKNSSFVSLYSLDTTSAKLEKTISTPGLALNIQQSASLIAVSDYTNGTLLYDKQLQLVQRIPAPSPVYETQIVNDSTLAVQMIDTRIRLYKRSGQTFDTNFTQFLSPGFTVAWRVANNMLYVLDKDSGLTVFPKLFLPEVSRRYEYFNGYEEVNADSSFVSLYSSAKGLEIYKADDAALETPLIEQHFGKVSPKFVKSTAGRFFFFYEDSIGVYDVSKNALSLVGEVKLPQPPISISQDGERFLINAAGNHWYLLSEKGMRLQEVQMPEKKTPIPYSLGISDASFVTTNVHRSPITRIFDVNHPSNYSRFAFWRAGLKMFRDHPLFGVGDIDLANLYRAYKRPYDKEIQGHLHNNFMHILATLGICGICAFLFLIYKLYAVYIATLKVVKGDSFYTALAIGGLAALTGFLVAGLTEWDFGDHEIITIVWLVTGLMVALKNFVMQKEESPAA